MNSIYIYLFCIYTLTWAIYLIGFPLDIMMFIPGIVGLIFIKKKVYKIFKFKITNIVLAFICIITIYLIYFAISKILNFSNFEVPKFMYKTSIEKPIMVFLRFLAYKLPYVFFINFIFAFFEEIGWRFFLYERMKLINNIGFFNRCLLIGILWSFWHLPIYLKNFFIFITFSLNVCLISIFYGFLYERFNGIISTSLAHTTHNIFFNFLIPIFEKPLSNNTIFYGEEGLIVSLSYLCFISFIFFFIKNKKIMKIQ